MTAPSRIPEEAPGLKRNLINRLTKRERERERERNWRIGGYLVRKREGELEESKEISRKKEESERRERARPWKRREKGGE